MKEERPQKEKEGLLFFDFLQRGENKNIDRSSRYFPKNYDVDWRR
ncbi:hypothetical protein [Anaerocellum danielii]|uniref:Uncharacterized protein n=1 Tax=Anaerocellum danielii TaxID=1387557 RepID=A0ABZ0TVZ3_9FIRM|nr:hypothetical protein [Caldicellulosiruptor danielii]WPX07614.1 hypothetical protein SOJ16_001423 [Caldicellulosiruptor danielii]